MSKEEWRWIKGYEGLYMVSNMGRIFGTPKKTHCGHELNQKKSKAGYMSVSLCKNSVKKTCAVHRIVANAFIPNPGNKPEVNHKNGVRSDNSVANLEWATRSENERHAYRELGKKANRPWAGKPRKFARRFSDEQIREIRRDSRSNTVIASDYGVSKNAIRQIKTRKVYFDVD